MGRDMASRNWVSVFGIISVRGSATCRVPGVSVETHIQWLGCIWTMRMLGVRSIVRLDVAGGSRWARCILFG
jgi:hypothetical protein